MDKFKKGGNKFNSNLTATNRLFAKNPLLKKRRKKAPGIYDPSAKYKFPDGGIVQLDRAPGSRFKKDKSGTWVYESGAPITDVFILQELNYGKGKPIGSPVVQGAPKVELKPYVTSGERIQKINDLQNSVKIADQQEANRLSQVQHHIDLYNPEVFEAERIKPEGLSDLQNWEWNMNEALNFPMERAHTAAAAATEDPGEEVDNLRHPLAGAKVAEGIINATGNIPYLSPAMGFIGSNLLGAGHEAMTLLNPDKKDDRSFLTRLQESGEDLYNNYVGAKVGASDMTPEEKTNYLLYLSGTNRLPDGIVMEGKPKKGFSKNVYFKHSPTDPGKYKSSYAAGGALLTKKVKCKKCGWQWDAADGGDDVTTCHKCGGQGLVQATEGGEYIEMDLTAKEIDEYRKGGFIVEDISVPSLNQMEEGGEPCPEGYTWDENTKACLPDEIIWAKDENDPIYQDYLIKKGLYDYSNYPNYSLREEAAYDLENAATTDNLSKIKDFSNSEYYKSLIEDAQDHYEYKKKHGTLDERALQEYENIVLNANRSFYGSPETYTQIPNDQLKSDPNIKDSQANGMFENEKTNSFLTKYPPVNWTKKSRYTSIPFTPSYGWTGENYGSSNHWTTPNTLFIEDNIDRKALKKIYPNMPDEFIDKYIAQQRKEPDYISNNYLSQYGTYDSPVLYDGDNYEYVLKTPTKTYTDKEGMKGYIQEAVNERIDKYYDYLPSWNKPEKTVMFMPPPMDIMPPGKIEQPKGKLVGTAEKILAPEYTTPNYKMDVPSYYKAHHNSSQLIPHARLRRSETDARVTRPFAKLTQKVTGYNPQAMEGYEDEEGNWIPGEIEQAQQEGRKIEFQGLGNLQDRAAQEKYNTEYDKYLMATKYPQMMLNGMLNRQTSTDLTKNKRQEGGASGCPPGPPPYHGVEPNIQGNEVPMFATPDPGAEFVPQTERYIDWDGNSIGFNGVRFRKPGHGGDLIKKGRRHYIHYPSIETRHSGDIVPEEEEFGMGGIAKYPNGGEPKPRKVRREVKPFTISNLKEYQKRKQAYDDSLTLYKASLQEHDLLKKTKGVAAYDPLYDKEAYDAYKRLGYPKGYNVNVKRSDNTNTRSVMYEKPVQPVNKKSKPVPKKPQPVNKKSQQVKPFVTSDPKEYALRKAAYDDSLTLYKNSESFNNAKIRAHLEAESSPEYMAAHPNAFGKNASQKQWDRLYAARNYAEERKQNPLLKNVVNKPDLPTPYFKKYGQNILPELSYSPPTQKVIFKESPKPTKKIYPPVVKEPVTYVNPPVEEIIPIKQPQPPVQDNYPPPPPPPAGVFPPEYHGVEPDIQGDPIPEYATPDRDAQWVAQKERYIDWNGNNISYKLPRFRKLGHSGPLVKGSRTHYLRYPSIETRNSADIIPEEEEFAMGGYIHQYPNGGQIYTYSGNPNASYEKVGDQWYISNKGTGNKFVPIQDPEGKRTAELNKNAVLLPGQPAPVEAPRPVQGAPRPVISRHVWEDATGTGQQNAIAEEKYLQGLKTSPKLADQELAKQIELQKANAEKARKTRDEYKMSHEQPLDMMDYAWFGAAALPAVLPAMGEVAATSILGSPLTYGNVGSLAFATNSALNTDNVVQDWRDVYAGKKDWRDAALNTGVTGLGFIGAGSGIKNLASTLSGERLVASAMPGFNTARTLELNKFITNENKLLPQGFGNGSTPLALPSVPVTNMIEAAQNLPKVNSELFNLNNIRKVSGSIGNQGATPEGARNILNSIGITVKSVNPGQPTLTEMVNHLKNNPQDAAKYQEFLQNEPIVLNELPGGEYQLNDGHHRATLAYYSGNESIPAIINNKGEYTGTNTTPSNFVEPPKEPWRMQPMSGLHLKSTMTDGAISKIVESKTGLINTEQALGIIAKESGGAEKVAMIKQALGKTVPKKMDYNDFRKLVQDQLIPLEKQLVNHSSTFGLQRIGHSPMGSQVKTYGLGDSDDAKIIENQTILFSNKNKFGIGSDAHSNPEETLGHAHFFRDSETPDALTITQLQSDAFQGPYRVMPKKGLDSDALDKELFKSRRMEEIQNRNKFILDKMKNERVDFNGNPVEDYQIKQFEEIVNSQEESNLLRKAHIEGFNQKSLLDKNHQERYIQEIVNYAAERGDINRLRLPTSETAAKIQGYIKTDQLNEGIDRDRIDMELENIFNTYGPDSEEMRNFYAYEEARRQEFIRQNQNVKVESDYSSEHKTILKKYAEQPKIIKKLYGIEPKIVTDGKGNTWYEFNIPYEFREGPAEIKAFKHGGSTSKLSKFIG